MNGTKLNSALLLVIGAGGGRAALFRRLWFFQAQGNICQFQQARARGSASTIVPCTIAIVPFEIGFGRNPEILCLCHLCSAWDGVLLFFVGQEGLAAHKFVSEQIFNFGKLALILNCSSSLGENNYYPN